MVELQVKVTKITAEKLAADDVSNRDVLYKVNVTMTETERNPGWAGISFTLDLTTEPAIARLQVSGTAHVGGTRGEVSPLLSSVDKAPPLILAKVYERVYGTVFLLCEALQVPRPLPTLMRA
jgi:hypothetical protein